MAENKLISIIVPIYNAEKYLDKCLQSIINQTLGNIEILLINDGSTDSSLEICKKYSERDSRIKIINKKNEGVSVARNLGIEKATGEYIAFIDSDDWIDTEFCERLYSSVKKEKAELGICNYIKENLDFKEFYDIKINKKILYEEDIQKTFLSKLIERDEGERVHNLAGFRGPCAKLYKKEILNNYDIKFDENLVIGEDFLFNLNFLQKTKRITLDKGYYYHYRTNFNSATMKYKKDCFKIYEEILKQLEEFLNKNDIYYKNKNRFYKLSIKYLLICLDNEFRKENEKNLFNKYKYLKHIGKNKYVIDALNYENFKDYTLNKKLLLFLFKYKQYWLINTIKYIKTML